MVLVVWAAGSYLYSVADLNRGDGGWRIHMCVGMEKEKLEKKEKQTLGLRLWMCIRGTGLVESWNLMCFNE
jgi:hypothetical protein